MSSWLAGVTPWWLGVRCASSVRATLALALGAAVAGLLLGGCGKEMREKILPIFFDAAPGSGERTPPPPTRRVRRDLLQEIEQLKRALDEAKAAAKRTAKPVRAEVLLPAEQARTWQEAGDRLPTDPAGNVNWVEALRAGTIAPRPSPDPKVPAQGVLDLDLQLTSPASAGFRADFSHASHTAWLACKSCHPTIFPLGRNAPPTVVTMAKIRQRQLCGVCHGAVAFGVEGNCSRCHTAIPAKSAWRPPAPPAKPIEGARAWTDAVKLLPVTDGAPDWTKALVQNVIAPRPGIEANAKEEDVLDLDVVRSEGEPTKVVFPHAAHTAWLVCDSCHPEPFQQAGGATPITMEDLNGGKLCGRCHGTVAFPVDACGRCHPALAG